VCISGLSGRAHLLRKKQPAAGDCSCSAIWVRIRPPMNRPEREAEPCCGPSWRCDRRALSRRAAGWRKPPTTAGGPRLPQEPILYYTSGFALRFALLPSISNQNAARFAKQRDLWWRGLPFTLNPSCGRLRLWGCVDGGKPHGGGWQ